MVENRNAEIRGNAELFTPLSRMLDVPGISVSKRCISFCKAELLYASNSPDPTHSWTHFDGMSKDFLLFVSHDPGLIGEVNFESFLPGFFGHDRGRIARFTGYLTEYVYTHYYEPDYAREAIRRRMERFHFDERTIAETELLTFEHAQDDTYPLSNPASKLLRAIDILDVLTARRAREMYQLSKLITGGRLIRNAIYYIPSLLDKLISERVDFEWAKEEIGRRKNIFKNELLSLFGKSDWYGA